MTSRAMLWAVPVALWLGAMAWLIATSHAFPDPVSTEKLLDSTELYDPAANTWTHGSRLHFARSNAAAALLHDGTVLITGGDGPAMDSIRSEVWSNGKLTLLDVAEPSNRSPKLVALPAGGALLFGQAVDGAWLLGPLTRRWLEVDAFDNARCLHGDNSARCLGRWCVPSMVALGPSQVMAVCGDDVELLDLRSQAWSRERSMNVPREEPHLHLLDDGRVLAVGRVRSDDSMATEIFGPEEHTWKRLADVPLEGALAISVVTRGVALVLAEDGVAILDVTAQRWSKNAPVQHPLRGASLSVLRDGRALLVGGGDVEQGRDAVPNVKVFDPVSRRWSDAAPLLHARSHHAAVTLADGRVLVAGGRVRSLAVDGDDAVPAIARFLALAILAVLGTWTARAAKVPAAAFVVGAALALVVFLAGYAVVMSALSGIRG